MEWPLDKRVFHVLVQKIVSVPNEIAVLDKEHRILTIYRDDAEYTGHHLPGTVLRDSESVEESLKRLLQDELAGNKIASIENIGWIEILKGTGNGMNPTRHELSLLWIARLEDEYCGEGVLSQLDLLPENTLSHHHLIVQKVRTYLQTDRPILGG